MTSLESACRLQKAVLWSLNTYDQFGDPKVNAASEIDVRWQYVTEEVIGLEGTPITVTSSVVVGQTIAVGSILRLGTLAGLASPVDNLEEVVAYIETPDVKNRYKRRVVKTRKYSDSLPTVV